MTLTFDRVTFSAMPTYMVNICAKFHRDPFSSLSTESVMRENVPDLAMNLTFDPMTLKTFSAMATHLVITYAKIHCNPSTK